MCRFARVLVSFGDKKYYTGIVITIHNDPPDFATKDITDILDTDPIVSPSQFELWQWIADYYICTLGEVMKAAIPAGLKLESETKLSVNTLFSDTDTLTPRQLDALNFIAEKKVCSLCELSKAMGGINPTAHVKALLDADAVYVSEQMRGTYRPKTEVAYALAHEYHSEDALLEVFNTLQSRAPRQLDALMLLIQQSGGMSQATSGKRVFRSALTSNPNVTATHLSELVKKGILMQDNVSISRIALPDAETCPPATLSEVQSQALSEILSSQNSCRPVLLQGVTGSGKTEIYIHLIQKTLAEGRNVLYLLPEIALTTQITNRLSKHFGPQMLVYHSKFSDSQRVEVYKMLLSSSSPYMLLGVRSSVLLPLANLGLIIVDEEHESSFKQYDPAPRYNARDMAVLLGSKQGALTILGSATPSLESFVNARDGRYAHVRLDQRHAGLQLPKVDVVDMKTARQHKEVDGIFSFRLRSAIAQALEANNQVILFQNRRGFSSYVECHQCAWVARCVNCDVALTYHKSSSQLVCHYCGHSVPLPITCPACGNPSLRPYGIGTEKIEEECLRLFPSARPVRMDLDTTRSRTAYEQIIADFAAHKHNILIGTQMVTKGLDFADVTLVGIINADGMLNMPDFRADERSFQLMAQVSGRAGRRSVRGQVYIQTSNPTHPIIASVVSANYDAHATRLVDERSRFHFPPFYRLIDLTIKHRNQQICYEAAQVLAADLRPQFGSSVVGPLTPTITKITNFYLQEISLRVSRSARPSQVKSLMMTHVNHLLAEQRFRSVIVKIDVDPY